MTRGGRRAFPNTAPGRRHERRVPAITACYCCGTRVLHVTRGGPAAARRPLRAVIDAIGTHARRVLAVRRHKSAAAAGQQSSGAFAPPIDRYAVPAGFDRFRSVPTSRSVRGGGSGRGNRTRRRRPQTPPVVITARGVVTAVCVCARARLIAILLRRVESFVFNTCVKRFPDE